MSFVAVVKALYDYDAQDPETELNFKEDQVIYVIDKEDDQWWKGKLKGEGDDADEPVGLIPANYVEEMQPMSHSRALYAYESTSPDEISMDEEAVLGVYEHQNEWDLVSVVHPVAGGKIGLVPANYTEALQPGEAEDLGLAKGRLEEGGLAKEVDVDGGAASAGARVGAPAQQYQQEEEEEEEEYAPPPPPPGPAPNLSGIGPISPPPTAAARSLAPIHTGEASRGGAGAGKKDDVQTWSIAELDSKGKKKKGSLGIGNGAVFFASETDKTPVQQYPITALLSYSTPSSKTLLLQFINASSPIQYHCGDKVTTDEIMRKLSESKEMAASGGSSDGPLSPPVTKGVRFSPGPATAFPPPPSRTASTVSTPTVKKTEECTALYDFEAQGEDELSIADGETLTVVERENEDWWTVKNKSGQQGVVPAQYVELNTASAESSDPAPPPAPPMPPAFASAPTSVAMPPPPQRAPAEADSDSDAEDAAEQERARKADQERREARKAEKERRRREQEDEDARREEEEERRREEKDKRRAERDRRRREEEAAKRREQARQASPPEPPKLRQRPSANDVAAARNLSIPKGRDAPDRPKGGDSGSGKSRPNPARTRVWHDKTGQFRVEAEFLGHGNGKIRLHKLNGVVIEVPIEKMSPDDLAYLKKVTRKERERERNAREADDDLPLAQVVQQRPSSSQGPSAESRARASPPVSSPSTAPSVQQAPRPKRPPFDWFEFFLSAGCEIDDCSRYAANFQKDRIDDSLLPDLETSTLKSLGLREGDVIRVKKAIAAKFRKVDPNEQDQITKDEELARYLQEEEDAGRGGRGSPANLFTSSDGKLANNTRRGRPERKNTVSSVDASGINAASDQLNRKPSPPLLPPSPPPAPAAPPAPKPAPLISGFDDDAWTVKPESAKPATPTPPQAPVVAPQPQQNSQAVTSQLNNLSLSNTGQQQQPDIFSQIPQNRIVSPQATGMGPGYNVGLGAGNSNMSMGQLQNHQQQQQQQQQQQPQSGPLAPVPANQGLLNPLVPTSTGFGGFVPTRSPVQGQPSGMMSQQTGFMPQQTGFVPNPTGFGGGVSMMPQQTGFMGGYGQQQGFQNMQPQMTGYNPMQQQQQQQQTSMFGQLAAIPPQQTGVQQPDQNKFNPANIFANMKRGDQASGSQSLGPQGSDKYDALRPQQTGLMPLTTGYNGAMMPQQPTGMMPQQTGYMNMQGGMQQQQQNPMYMQQTGFMPRQGGYGY